MNENLIGKEYESNSCGRFKLIEYNSSKDVLVEFINTGYQTRTIMSSVRNGAIKDRRHPSVYGVGYLGDTHNTSVKGVLNKQGDLWKSMLERCYSKNYMKDVQLISAVKLAIISKTFLISMNGVKTK